MKRMVETYAGDVAPYASMSLSEFYDHVKRIPYKFDLINGKLAEVVKRPYYTLNQIGLGGDCDDKAIVMGAWAKLNGIPYRFKAVGKKLNGNLHHVYPELLLSGQWTACDATYPHNTLGVPMNDYKKVVIYG